ncbi:hypothetical protein SAMN05660690_1462 [Geodermatophilus telluris]|uniref:DUF6779 domain-containing protein n=1 Tax=Geodermatophilus telluris TaxID=1190417 RepID=A0A1G6LME3_9ACTN|nr:DUF6779 domain-containing protein [Geodermatophilus telluris]SDC44403.1 hypothetical protein SAMN05660690_1462 [Geodermatophilus telluris]
MARRPPGPAGAPGLRAVGLALGACLALAATVVVFLTEDARVLRVSVVAVAWACLLAAVAAGRRPARDAEVPDVPDTAALEAELRRAYDAELEREVAARQRYELELENEVRREAEQSMRRELDALRAELAGLREGLSGLGALRAEVGALAGPLAELGALRADLAEIGGLRADVGRLRAELTEQLTGEMRVERLVMHTQSVRTAAGREPLEPAATWSGELDADWPAPAVTVAAPAVAREPEPPARPLPLPPLPARPEPAASPSAPPSAPPAAWPAGRGPLDPADAAPRRRHTDPLAASAPPPAEQLTVERPALHTAAAGHAAPSPGVPGEEPDATGSARLAQILAESGVTPGGRRHRYRD